LQEAGTYKLLPESDQVRWRGTTPADPRPGVAPLYTHRYLELVKSLVLSAQGQLGSAGLPLRPPLQLRLALLMAVLVSNVSKLKSNMDSDEGLCPDTSASTILKNGPVASFANISTCTILPP